ncbi:hypothetical protein SAMN05216249_11041 [Acetitomaculum ruminis DSM 5522]|uniref:Uncharacterized protein n=1 Tax=Acetitomaculum ruminis DSM 5522 TaxID=1120918 RepID=A0A1I0YJY8_9FIRM|nr:hypothetical protein [Acetitomaculum ruminis]SFB13096.1 hypothetical protein SAMN05216249_11041 [Acetitomaculum ruminis DSM 5522]
MESSLIFKTYVNDFYAKYKFILVPIFKFILTFAALMLINMNLGYFEKVNNIIVALFFAFICAFLPQDFMALTLYGLVIVNLIAFSKEIAIVPALLILLLWLVCARFNRKELYVAVLTVVLMNIKIGMAVPVIMGLLGSSLSILPVGSGVIIYYVLNYISKNATTIQNVHDDSMIEKIGYIANQIFENKTMLVMMITFVLCTLIVYLIRKSFLDNAWTIAIVAGILVLLIGPLLGGVLVNVDIDIVSLAIGNISALILGFAVLFFNYSGDYSRVEHVEFEDDNYYYYVKAVSKKKLAAPDKKVKTINSREKSAGEIADFDENKEYEEIIRQAMDEHYKN